MHLANSFLLRIFQSMLLEYLCVFSNSSYNFKLNLPCLILGFLSVTGKYFGLFLLLFSLGI